MREQWKVKTRGRKRLNLMDDISRRLKKKGTVDKNCIYILLTGRDQWNDEHVLLYWTINLIPTYTSFYDYQTRCFLPPLCFPHRSWLISPLIRFFFSDHIFLLPCLGRGLTMMERRRTECIRFTDNWVVVIESEPQLIEILKDLNK